MQVASEPPKNNKFLALIFLFIASDIMCDNYIIGAFNHSPPLIELLLLFIMLSLQIIISPIQAGTSDLYGRRKSLLFSILFSLLSLVFVFLFDMKLFSFIPMLILINISKGIFGNTIPISWAAVGDLSGKNLRLSFAFATAAYATGYIGLVFFNKYLPNSIATFILIILFSATLFMCFFYFFDLKDIKTKELHYLNPKFCPYIVREISLIIADLKDKAYQNLFTAYILWEISIYVILILYADFMNNNSAFIEVLMMIGFLLGVSTFSFSGHISDSKMIRIGYVICVASLLPYFFFVFLFQNINIVLAGCYFFHAIGNALLSPTIFCLVGRGKADHEKGKIYGLVESADTIAFLIAIIFIMFYKYLQLQIIYLVSVSLITALISWIPYRRFEKLRGINPSVPY